MDPYSIKGEKFKTGLNVLVGQCWEPFAILSYNAKMYAV